MKEKITPRTLYNVNGTRTKSDKTMLIKTLDIKVSFQ